MQYILRSLIKFQLNLMIWLKISSNNIKLVKLWFFVKFPNFSNNYEILTQAKASY